MVASGTVDDYTPSVQTEIRTNFAETSNVDVAKVALSVTPASVRLELTITSSSASAASSVETALSSSLASASAASALLPAGLTVEEAPTVATSEVAISPPSPAPTPPPTGNADEGAGSPTPIIAGAGAVVALLLIGLLVRRQVLRSRKGRFQTSDLTQTFQERSDLHLQESRDLPAPAGRRNPRPDPADFFGPGRASTALSQGQGRRSPHNQTTVEIDDVRPLVAGS